MGIYIFYATTSTKSFFGKVVAYSSHEAQNLVKRHLEKQNLTLDKINISRCYSVNFEIHEVK
jgi:hypothetical protein